MSFIVSGLPMPAQQAPGPCEDQRMSWLSLCQTVIVVITCELGQTDRQILGVVSRVGAGKNMPASCCHQSAMWLLLSPWGRLAGMPSRGLQGTRGTGMEQPCCSLGWCLLGALPICWGVGKDGVGSSQLAVGRRVWTRDVGTASAGSLLTIRPHCPPHLAPLPLAWSPTHGSCFLQLYQPSCCSPSYQPHCHPQPCASVPLPAVFVPHLSTWLALSGLRSPGFSGAFPDHP